MAKASFQLDPNAVVYSDDEIVEKVNTAAANITRAGAVTKDARPLEVDEVTATEIKDGEVAAGKLAAGVAKTNLDGMGDTERGYVKTDPQTGEFPVVAVQRDAEGKLDVDYDDAPKS